MPVFLSEALLYLLGCPIPSQILQKIEGYLFMIQISFQVDSVAKDTRRIEICDVLCRRYFPIWYSRSLKLPSVKLRLSAASRYSKYYLLARQYFRTITAGHEPNGTAGRSTWGPATKRMEKGGGEEAHVPSHLYLDHPFPIITNGKSTFIKNTAAKKREALPERKPQNRAKAKELSVAFPPISEDEDEDVDIFSYTASVEVNYRFSVNRKPTAPKVILDNNHMSYGDRMCDVMAVKIGPERRHLNLNLDARGPNTAEVTSSRHLNAFPHRETFTRRVSSRF
ncbi:hypothetical protein DFH08DRAFT_1002694 [Mycena albidolilacea]|uniref:Uncharacterized protein n=1 Tax=Mycena albidolilacea TaxID=1033008 RepID=A0AAD7AQN3_9AGAR|nr:hypothetical protein DFH08DRAFT_1002694 [Mycena albidolilacea]